ncbi:hypothetical protein XI09_00860 [Bradyrhizobium sp. CCBAU 11386]|uniref:hypothetical protein n=1 Tax=Bradyrhizobium sp. CCBAU 11386 TaxID=1630837 RepID=UPI002FE2B6D5|nr:hypothetical protein [Bradyrhizobium sp. CCBAU 11386]
MDRPLIRFADATMVHPDVTLATRGIAIGAAEYRVQASARHSSAVGRDERRREWHFPAHLSPLRRRRFHGQWAASDTGCGKSRSSTDGARRTSIPAFVQLHAIQRSTKWEYFGFQIALLASNATRMGSEFNDVTVGVLTTGFFS